jgi:lipoprotein-anchoring transpeptidase ErfK/SrfK
MQNYLRIIFAALVLMVISVTVGQTSEIDITIDISEQSMVVKKDDQPLYNWLVSTGREGFCSPVGTYHPIRLERMWYSTKYDNAPMPHSIFFYGGYAIHGTTEISKLGNPASHGCIRLHPANAEVLFNLVEAQAFRHSTIQIKP